MLNIKLSLAVNNFLEYLENLDADTKRAYTLDLNAFILNFEEDISINQISTNHLKIYLNNLKTKDNKRVSVSTQNRHYATLKRFFDWLKKENYIQENLFENLKRRRPNKDLGEVPSGSIIRSLTQDQIEQLLQNLKEFELREQVLFLLIYTTGLRISEALKLKIEDIQEDGSILVRSTKGNKPRKTFVGKILKPLLKKYISKLEKNSWLFPSIKLSAESMSYGRARQLFTKISQGIKNYDGSKITIHQLRHTFATERVGYIDSILLMDLMGHSDIRTTLRYAKADVKAIKNAFDVFDQRKFR